MHRLLGGCLSFFALALLPVAAHAELSITIAAPEQAYLGEAIPFDVTVRNDGEQALDALPYAIVLSANDVLSDADFVVHEGALDVPAGAALTERVEARVTGVGGGRYFVALRVDLGAAAGEAMTVVAPAQLWLRDPADELPADLPAFPPATRWSMYTAIVPTAGGTGDDAWTLSFDGGAPPGLSMTAEEGAVVVMGTPEEAGTFLLGATLTWRNAARLVGLPLLVLDADNPLDVGEPGGAAGSGGTAGAGGAGGSAGSGGTGGTGGPGDGSAGAGGAGGAGGAAGAPGPAGSPAEPDDGGCAASAAAPSLMALGCALALLRRRG